MQDTLYKTLKKVQSDDLTSGDSQRHPQISCDIPAYEANIIFTVGTRKVTVTMGEASWYPFGQLVTIIPW